MKRILIAAMMLALAAPAAAQQLYKWVDKDGKTHYSDTPPAGQEAKAVTTGNLGGGTHHARRRAGAACSPRA